MQSTTYQCSDGLEQVVVEARLRWVFAHSQQHLRELLQGRWSHWGYLRAHKADGAHDRLHDVLVLGAVGLGKGGKEVRQQRLQDGGQVCCGEARRTMLLGRV